MIVTKGATDVTTYVMIVDSTTGAPETGVTIANLDMQYTRNREAPAAKVDMTALAATNTAHTDNYGIQVDATSSPGLYRVDWPDAAFATGADKVMLVVTGTGFAPAVLLVELVNYNTQDGVRMGLTALPNAAADAAGGLPISDAGGLDLDAKLANTNEVTVARMGALTDWINGGRLDLILDDILLDTGTDGVVVASGSKTGYSLTATTGLGNQTANITGTITTATNVTTVNGLAAGVITAASIAADAITDAKVASDVTIASVTGAVGSVTGAVGSVTGNVGGNVTGSVGSVAAGGIAAASFAAGAIDAAAVAADAGTEIGTAVWASATRTLTSLSGLTVDTVTTLTNLPAITANWLTAAGTAADFTTEIQAGLATAANLAIVAGYLDTEVAAIKAKTDSLNFTVAGQVDSNIQYVNDVAVTGTGASGSEWGPV